MTSYMHYLEALFVIFSGITGKMRVGVFYKPC